MSVIYIIGATPHTNRNGTDEWSACYVCDKCGEEFAASSDFHKTEKSALEESRTRFDLQQRRFCCRCGYKLTSSDPKPESEYIASLNLKIKKLEDKRMNKTSNYGERFKNAVGFMKNAMKNGECHILECLEDYKNFSVELLNKYPLAIRRLIKIIWEHLEFYVSYFANVGEEKDDEELLFRSIAELEELESELHDNPELLKGGEPEW